ncbi:MAG: lysylphosphatidylglycerol synthase transmembrane domain-containing protein [Anaerolineales bacterium]|nr:flippase-like domain-containing protein [Anaerolineales bacterium]MCS7247998.1 flippase-like domain-containing protein [Anaerolineales bacterium]MDW8161810.1 lysylphosphatidylglycerol synthase transmembrane domain-containing protein [Anaerolineales bacterium]MDW8446495.1 lysylphosphatidylglycerol synthase transmembrane domain-containing protein [Anaerolineales bacterium]
MRHFLFLVLILLGILFLITGLGEVQTIWETLREGDWRFILLALIVQSIWVINLGATYQSIYHLLGTHDNLKRLISLALASNFANIVAPSVGMSGMAVFIAEARKNGLPVGKVTLAGILFLLVDYVAFLFILALGLIVLFRRHDLDLAEIVASILLLLLALGIAAVIFIGARSPLTLGKILAGLARAINRLLSPLLRRDYLSEQRAYEFAQEVSEGIRALRSGHRNLIIPLLHGLLNKFLLLTTFTLMFFAFKVPISIGTVVASFSVGYLFMIVSPTPAGIGFVEGAMTLALSSFYIPISVSAVLALAYRGFTFWYPLFLGFLAFRALTRSEPSWI